MVQGRALILALAGGAGIGSSAFGGLIGDAVYITATNAAGKSASWSISSVGATWINETVSWKVTGAIDLRAPDGEFIARLDGLEVGYIADPVVSLNFAVTAGASTTSFTISSAQLSFPQMTGAVGRASGAVTVTDLDGNGASLVGDYAGAKTYTAHRNGLVGGSGTDFAVIVSSAKAGSYSSGTQSESNPPAGFIPAGTLDSMHAQFSFDLSGNDQASGTSVFVVVPAPAAAALGVLGVGGLGALRRRRA